MLVLTEDVCLLSFPTQASKMPLRVALVLGKYIQWKWTGSLFWLGPFTTWLLTLHTWILACSLFARSLEWLSSYLPTCLPWLLTSFSGVYFAYMTDHLLLFTCFRDCLPNLLTGQLPACLKITKLACNVSHCVLLSCLGLCALLWFFWQWWALVVCSGGLFWWLPIMSQDSSTHTSMSVNNIQNNIRIYEPATIIPVWIFSRGSGSMQATCTCTLHDCPCN